MWQDQEFPGGMAAAGVIRIVSLELLLLQKRLSGGRETCESAVVTVEALDAKGLCWWWQRSGQSFSDIQGAEPGDADCSGGKRKLEITQFSNLRCPGRECGWGRGKRANSINTMKSV